MIISNFKKKLSLCLATFIIGVNVMCISATVFAEPNSLNEIGGSQATVQTEPTTKETSTTTTQDTSSQTQTSTTEATGGSSSNVSSSNSESAAAVGELFKQGALTQDSVDKAAKWVKPVAKVINVAMAIVLGIFSAILVFISVLDLVYIGVPAVRPYLMPGGGAQQQAGGAPMMGMNSYGAGRMGMPGMNGGMAGMNGGMQQSQGAAATIGQWISDDAKQAVAEAQQQAGGGATGMPGMPGMMNAQQAPVKGKNLVVAYMKKRAFSLIMLGVCLVLFTCTIFTDLGTMLGMKILALLSGINF